MWRSYGVFWTEDSLLKLKIAPEEQCKFYALLAIHLYMWDQVLNLAVLLCGIKGLALEVEQKSFAYLLCLFWFYMKDCDLVIYFQFFDRADPSN